MRIYWFFIWTNLNPFHPRMLCAKIGWNWPSGFGEEYFKISDSVFSLFHNNLPLEKGKALHLNKLESPSSKDGLCQVWLKLTQWFWRRRFLNFINVFSLFRNYLPLEKGRRPFHKEIVNRKRTITFTIVWRARMRAFH